MGTFFFGIACSKDELEQVLDRLSQHAPEISIDPNNIPSEIRHMDIMRILQDDIETILSHDLDEHESYQHLMRNYVNSRTPQLSEQDSVKAAAMTLLRRGLENAEIADLRLEAAEERRKEEAHKDLLPKQFNPFLETPQRESFRRKK